MPFQCTVSYAACLDEAISAASRQGNANTDRAVEGHPCLDELHEGKIAVMRMYVSTEILQISGEAV